MTAASFVLTGVRAAAQVVPGEIVPPGETVASSTDADNARVNPGGVALGRGLSVRFTHVSELRAGNTALNADALSVTAPLLLGFAGAAGVSWMRPEALGFRGHVVSADLGLAYALTHNLGLGATVRVTGAGGDSGLEPVYATGALDLGILWRALPELALGLVGRNLVGAAVPAIGIERGFVGGVGLRPGGTDVFTLGLDAAFQQAPSNSTPDGWFRAGARVRIPYVGYVRAEGVLDWPTGAWRAGAGLDVVLGQGSVGGGALFGGRSGGAQSPLGFYATARWEASERDRGIPSAARVVSITSRSSLGGRGMVRMLLRLERLRRDPTVRGVVFAPREDVAGLANAEELRDAFGRLRASGKRVVCHLLEPSGATYYACAAADSVVMDPAGSLRMMGIRTARFFLGDALREIGVRTQFVRIGAWKSAPEQFTRNSSTPEALAQEEQLLDDYMATFVHGIAVSRRTDDAHARALIVGGPYGAREAQRAGLVDALGDRGFAEAAAGLTQSASVIDYEDYVPMRSSRWSGGPAVAVLNIEGDIIQGESVEIPLVGIRLVGDRSVIAQVEALEADPRVRAVVVRVDSGGGAATAGEMIWRAIARLARHKPVVVSIGSIAASGGYYIIAPGREIFAEPSSLTGSIGIFFGKADISELLGRLHVGVELDRRGEHADMDSIFRPSTRDELAIGGRLIQQFYELFLQRVAQGRHMTTGAVDAVGQGRVFSGTRASGIGLVDRLAGLDAAVDRARELARLPSDSDVIDLPVEPQGLIEQLFALVTGSTSVGPGTPAALLLDNADVRAAVGWLFAVAYAGRDGGHVLALTEWPVAAAR